MSESTKQNPEAIEKFVKNGIRVLKAASCPKACFKGCSGVVLIQAEEDGMLISATGGTGVLVGHKNGTWSSPVAVNYSGLGVGVVVGFAQKDVVVFLNPFAMKRLIGGSGHIKLGADIGIAL